MFNGLAATNSISFLLVFIEGLLSFFSPCVIPLIPIYMSYLAGNAKQVSEDGTLHYQRGKVFLHTLFFVLGISFAFFILGMSFTALGTFFKSNQLLFTRIGGILILLLGLVQVGFLELKFLQREHKFHINLADREVTPLLALLMGFTFSFAWTPCVGPALSSVLILASGSSSRLTGNLLVLIYTLGFIIPFLILGLFTTGTLNFLKGHQRLLRYTVKAGGILLIIIGIMTFTGWMNRVSGYLNKFTLQLSTQNQDNREAASDKDDTAGQGSDISMTDASTKSAESDNTDMGYEDTDRVSKTDGAKDASVQSDNDRTDNQSSTKTAKDVIPAFDFTLTDQYGKEHTLSDYKDKIVFLNFWATWCPPCQAEMPDIEELYQEYGQNTKDIIILGVANPTSEKYPKNADVSKEEIIKFLEENNLTFPVVFDETGTVLNQYYITAFPTTFMITKEGNIYGYVPGKMTKDIMYNIINQTLEATE